MPELSVIIPVYNERETIEEILNQVRAVDITKEIIIVEDCSTDGTREYLEQMPKSDDLRIVFHEHNRGKGAAVRSGIAKATGDYVVIQDADLEYDPNDYGVLIEPLRKGKADVVYGSRFLGSHRVLLFWNYIANRFLTFLTNALYNCNLSDMETCYKMFRREVIQGITLRSNRFDIEPEITAKILKNHYRVFEVPISYAGRDYDEGKKITWKDGVAALWTLLKYRFTD